MTFKFTCKISMSISWLLSLAFEEDDEESEDAFESVDETNAAAAAAAATAAAAAAACAAWSNISFSGIEIKRCDKFCNNLQMIKTC